MTNSEEILKSLSIDEKIRLLNGVGNWDTYDANGKLPVISVSDGPHGLRHQTGEESVGDINDSVLATCFPTASAIACSWNENATKEMARAIAREAKALKVQIILGCGMNIKRSPLCGRNFEYFSEDPLLSGELASAFVLGMKENGTGACLKHFALNNQEKYRQSSSSNVDERTMREIYLSGFERAVKKGEPVSIMCSYNRINGTYASCNKKLLTDILRNDWGYKGFVMSDWGADIDAANSLKAGLDLGMPDSSGYLGKQIKAAYEKGSVSEADIDAACRRIINAVLELDEKKSLDARDSVDFAEQHKVAFDLACDSAVLLKNDGFYPLQVSEGSARLKIVVVGQLAEKTHFQGGGSSHINTADYPSALECLKKDFDVIYIPGYLSTFCKKSKKDKINAKLRNEAVKLLRDIMTKEPELPVLYFCGLEQSYEGEGFDRDDMSLPLSHLDLYKEISGLVKNLGLVTYSGSPIDLQFADKARAILQMYLCGEASGQACHALLTGRKNPSGKLAETWPVKVESGLPVNGFDVDYIEGTLVGYRWYETKNIPVQYEFGYGLSYTNFEYSDLKIEKLSNEAKMPFDAMYNVSLSVENTGKVAGSEIVQIYVKNPQPAKDSGITRASIELRAFKKIFLNPGEKKELSLQLDQRAFSIYSTKKNCFATVGGEYEICAASSVKKIQLSEKVQIVGEEITALLPSDSEDQAKVFVRHERHKRGEFTVNDTLSEMAKYSAYVRCLLKLFEFYIIMNSESKSRDDPAVKINISGIAENPLECLISISGGLISEKLVAKILKSANR